MLKQYHIKLSAALLHYKLQLHDHWQSQDQIIIIMNYVKCTRIKWNIWLKLLKRADWHQYDHQVASLFSQTLVALIRKCMLMIRTKIMQKIDSFAFDLWKYVELVQYPSRHFAIASTGLLTKNTFVLRAASLTISWRKRQCSWWNFEYIWNKIVWNLLTPKVV